MTTPFFLTTCCVSIGVIAVIWFWPVASLRRDNFRSDIRRIRDELFDFAWESGLGFDHKAYRDARQFLNGTLRMSNQLSPAQLLLGLFLTKWYRIEMDTESVRALKGCPEELRDKLLSVYDRAIHRILGFMFAGSGAVCFQWNVGLTNLLAEK